MTMLSVIIPARNEIFLSKTVDSLVQNIRGDTDVIAVLDGYWPDPPVEDYPNVTIIYCPESIGQRAATNLGARVSTAKYVMKMDAHCSVDEGFDVKMLEVMQDDYTLVPIMKNLHAFDWVCKNGHRRYQSPSGPCQECGEPTEMDVVWIAKNSPSSTAYCFDRTLHFYYMNEMKKRPNGQPPLSETMSLQGSCFMITRERYFDLNICDESWGSWGNQGTEVACKSWLSGGQVLCNWNTWYAHMFRTQGADFSFPYPQSGRAIERARQRSRDLFLNNQWEKQVRPLSWLVEKFWPIEDLGSRPGWNQEDLDRIKAFDTRFSLPIFPSSNSSTLLTDSLSPIIGVSSKNMPSDTKSFLPSTSGAVLPSIHNQDVIGIATKFVLTDVVQDGCTSPIKDTVARECVNESMNPVNDLIDLDLAVSGDGSTSPVPASTYIVDNNSGTNTVDLFDGQCRDRAIISLSHDSSSHDELRLESDRVDARSDSIISPTRGIVYYTHNEIDQNILLACQRQLLKATNKDIIIMSVSLKPLDFGKNIVLPLEPGYLTMFKQILAGLEALDADIVFFAEHDVLYSPSHFDFAPPKSDVVYYNMNTWKVRLEDGHALRYDCKQTSGLCAYRDTLIAHYRQRVINTEEKLNQLGDTHEYRKFIRGQGFEPGTHNRSDRVDDLKAEGWWSAVPIVDIRHNSNLTPSRWSQDQFRDKRNCRGWLESDNGVPGWDNLEIFT